ncbi:glycosyltransferase family 2 protein [Muricoccus nepalensis]|uniref:glycosyltransferase family 2 protein n=1 Tax=Muricoccus nepalensis TaxID=1854500 RepID=UPI0013868A7B|nr:glycosyltransferase family 2 protein [Roseomonas nepalensis]
MPSDTACRVDVLIPVYNAANTVRASLRSIQEQTVSDVRILVIDDGSTDATAAIVSEISLEDPRLELIRKPFNSGIVDTLNVGFGYCRSPYIARHDADDVAYPNRFEVQLRYLETHADCVAVGAATRLIDAAGRHQGGYSRLPQPDIADPHWFPSREPYILHPFLMIRRDALVAVGGYRHAFHAEDTDLYWRVQERGGMCNLPDLLGEYRIHAGSISGTSIQNGRISALNSQLSAISAVRRRSGLPDLVFPPERLAAYRQTDTTTGLLQLVMGDLTPEERAYLELAVAVKIVEGAIYRPYYLDEEDCRFVRRTLTANWYRFCRENTEEVREKLVSVGTKMVYGRRLREVAMLLPPTLLARTLGQVARFSLEARLRRWMRRLRSRPAI